MEIHDGVTWQPNHSIPKNRENSFLPEGTGLTLLPAGLTLLPLYIHPRVTPYQSNTLILLYHGRIVPGSRYTRDRTSPHEAFQILIAYRGIRTLPSQYQSVNPNYYTIPCWKTMEHYRTRESNTQTTTSARRNY
jgi:hypothetical protein